MAIGNVPFGTFKVLDKKYDKYNFLIHDYFFARALDKVRPGGVVKTAFPFELVSLLLCEVWLTGNQFIALLFPFFCVAINSESPKERKQDGNLFLTMLIRMSF